MQQQQHFLRLVVIYSGTLLQQAVEAVRSNNANFSGGFTESGEVEKPVRVIGRLGPRPEQVVADLKKIPVRTSDRRAVLNGAVGIARRIQDGWWAHAGILSDRSGIAISLAGVRDHGQVKQIERLTAQPINVHVVAGLEPRVTPQRRPFAGAKPRPGFGHRGAAPRPGARTVKPVGAGFRGSRG